MTSEVSKRLRNHLAEVQPIAYAAGNAARISTEETIPASRRTSIAARTSGVSTYPHDSGDSSSTCRLSDSRKVTMQPSHPWGAAGQPPQSIENMIYLTLRPGRV